MLNSQTQTPLIGDQKYVEVGVISRITIWQAVHTKKKKKKKPFSVFFCQMLWAWPAVYGQPVFLVLLLQDSIFQHDNSLVYKPGAINKLFLSMMSGLHTALTSEPSPQPNPLPLGWTTGQTLAANISPILLRLIERNLLQAGPKTWNQKSGWL